ncbi:hypothetical protein EKO04_004018 [Ascochyta lentis]|uniref:DUF6536 domain-containing protein n=1 Tax=Ascochyta lentis TaxID=205686 RepID=A0A8H7J3M2_9PLEO|nr:hypothetical protein EKO04_004018 [Ascochyta lentis]
MHETEGPLDISGNALQANQMTSNPRFASRAMIGQFVSGLDLEKERPSMWTRWRSKHRTILIAMCAVAGLATITNLVTAVVFRYKYGAKGGYEGGLFRGDCAFASRLNLGLHIAINAISTMLLAASNLCMQLLMAPTRSMIDKAHAQQRWLDIGIPGFHNFRHVTLKKRVVWVILALSSLPLHFLYNSVVYKTQPAMLYQAYVVTPEFLTGAAPNATEARQTFYSRANRTMYALSAGYHPRMMEMSLQGFPDDFNHCHLTDCQSANDVIYGQNTIKLSAAECQKPSTWKRDPAIIKDWNIYGWKIDYCLDAQTTNASRGCAVKYSFPLLLSVCVTGICKFLCIIYTAHVYSAVDDDDMPLMNLGDAIQSLLRRTDDATMDRCLQGKAAIRNKEPKFWLNFNPEPWKPHPSRWFGSASRKRWYMTAIPFALYIASGIAMLGFSTWNSLQRYGDFWHSLSIGIGDVDQSTFAILGLNIGYQARNRYILILFANFWQFFTSMLYIQSNALLTAMCVESEWQSYSLSRKSLRVFSPKGLQRSTYFVSVPLKYGLSLQAASVFFHWMISQSVFLIEAESVHPANLRVNNSAPLLGSSPKGIIIIIAAGLFTMAMFLLAAAQKHVGNLPAGATCSAVVSAACHRPKEDKEAYLFPVQWGEVPEEARNVRCTNFIKVEPPQAQANDPVVGHCCFTTASSVTLPRNEKLYQ